MTITLADYSKIMGEILLKAAHKKQPVSGTFELTERCNMACQMCYVNHSADDLLIRNKELSAGDWLSLASEAIGSGMVFLLLTGGEIFLRQDFFDIYEPMTRMGVIITLFTNGTLISNSIAERLAQLPPRHIEITLYGATTNTYDNIAKLPGGYKQCCDGIENLLEYEIPLVLKTIITRQNVHELDAMREMAQAWGVPFYADWLLSRRRDGYLSNIDLCRLSASECIELEASDNASAHEWRELALRRPSTGDRKSFYCQAGKSSFVVTSSGEMNVCLDLPLPGAIPLDIGFEQAWQHVQQFVESSPQVKKMCLDCDVKDYCPRCPAWSYLETGTLSDPVPYLCQLAYERKRKYKR